MAEMFPSIDLVIFTDLDGTLLDHESYDWTPAKPLLDQLTDAGVPVVLTSSKTPAELVSLRAEMGLAASPAICENGAGLLPPGETTLPPRDDWHALREALDGIDPALRGLFHGFGDMSVTEVAAVTGLSLDAARLAHARAFTEPGLWRGTDAERAGFLRAGEGLGLIGRDGGRFLTIGPPTTKADTMARVARDLGAKRTIALGDAPNDVEMIETATRGIIIPNPHRTALPPLAGEDSGRVLRSALPGPTGWAQTLAQVLSDFPSQQKGQAFG